MLFIGTRFSNLYTSEARLAAEQAAAEALRISAEAARLAERGLGFAELAPALRASLLLVRAVAYRACGDDAAAAEGVKTALTLDAGYAEAIGADVGSSHEKLHEVLRARLQRTQHP